MNNEKLINLKNKIENLDKTHHGKILNVLIQNEVKFSENRNGSFVNMNNLNETTIEKIEEILKYINIQENVLHEFEKIKNELNHDYFSNKKLNDLDKDNKDIVGDYN